MKVDTFLLNSPRMNNSDLTQHKSLLRRVAEWPQRVVRFYVDGFRSMTVGRYLWALIIVKLFILFFIFKLFFFPDVLKRDYDTDEERAAAVRHKMIERTADHSPATQPE